MTSITPAPSAALTQNNVLSCTWLISGRWMVAIDKPRSVNTARNPVIAVTIAMRPKSCGSRSRARTIIDAICRPDRASWEMTVTAPPRTARSRSPAVRRSVSKSGFTGSQKNAFDARDCEADVGTGA